MQDALYGAVRWSVGHARGVYGALGIFLLAGLATSALAAALFALLARGIGGGAMPGFDEAAVGWIREHRSPLLDGFAIAGAVLGSGTVTWIVLGAGTLVLAWARRFYSVGLLWLALPGGRILSAELKALFARPRPRADDWDLSVFGRAIDFPASPSFPSGHAVTSVIVFGTLALLVVRMEPTVRLRRWTLAAAAALIGLIGLSRIYLGVHYPSDVLAGYLAGFVWVAFAAFAIEVVRYFAARRPETRRMEEHVEEGLDPVREALGGRSP